jgi:O-succinylbenzoic acid--CoA ligase
MDASLLTSQPFWEDPAPVAAGDFPGAPPDMPALRGHVLFATSGSSGAPKWIALTKQSLLASAAAVNRHLGVTSSSCWGLALPLHHVGGFGVAARAFQAGCALREFTGRWDVTTFVGWLENHLVSHTSLVPTQVHDLVAAGAQAPAVLRAIVVGGGHLDVRTGRAARALGWPVLASFGMTEAASQIATQELESLATLYQPEPLPLLPIWQAATTADQVLRIAGPALFSGLLERDDENQWVFHPRSESWHQTADRVALDHGFLTPIGRADALVKVLGELVDPALIERELAELSAGRLAPGGFAVVAIPDARAQHLLVPVFAASVDKDTIAAVLAAYAAQAPGFRRLQPAVVLRKFPRSPLGKPLRPDIVAAVCARR